MIEVETTGELETDSDWQDAIDTLQSAIDELEEAGDPNGQIVFDIRSPDGRGSVAVLTGDQARSLVVRMRKRRPN